MVHVHGARVRSQMGLLRNGSGLGELIAVPVDVGKSQAMALVADFTGQRLTAPFVFSLDRRGLGELVVRVERAVEGRQVRLVRLGVEAAGHYHRPLTCSRALPAGWQVVELNPAHVTAQRRVNGQRGIKTDQVDLAAIFDLVVAGRGYAIGEQTPTLVELAAWVAHRGRRVQVRTATKNQLLGQVDRCFPGLQGCLSASLLDTKVGRLLVTHFTDPARLARLGVERFCRFAVSRDVRVRRELAERVVAAAKAALPTAEAPLARQVVAADLALLAELDHQIAQAELDLARLLPTTPFGVLVTTPGWGTVRAASYGAALRDPARWPSPRHVYRASGLTPRVYESAGKRRDGTISREGSVGLRRALLELGKGLWLCEPAARHYAHTLRARGKPQGVIACALANRANRIAFAMVRHHRPYDPTCWKEH